jgi:hypothetical protein
VLSYTSEYDQLHLLGFLYPMNGEQQGGTKESPAAGRDLTNVISITDFVEIFC